MHNIKCPLCGSDIVSSDFRRKDLLSVYHCNICKLRFVDQRDLTNLYGEIDKIYDKEYFEGIGDLGYRGYSEIPQTNFYWQKAFLQLIDEIKGKKILDIGCGTGRLMEMLKDAEVDGIELSKYAADIAVAKGLHVISKDLMSLKDESAYDIVTAFDLIEHIPDVKALLNKVKSLLKDEGVFIFLTPDAGSAKALTEKERWYGYNSSLEHLYYFSAATLRFIFNEIFGSEPILYQAVAPDGEGILGFIRKTPDESDDVLRRLFNSNFPPELISEKNVIPVCILLQRLNDRRFTGYAETYRSFILENADKEELQTLLTAIDRMTEEKRATVSVNPATGMMMKIIPPHPPLAKGERGDYQVKKITIRKYQEGDEYGIVRLFKEVFGREMTIEEWRRKYKGQRNDTVHSVVAVNAAGEIIGHFGGVPLRTIYAGGEVNILSGSDLMIHPKYRGFWALKRITSFFRNETEKKGFRMCFGFPTEDTLMLPAEKEKLNIMERCIFISEAEKEVRFHNTLIRFLYRLSPLSFRDERINRLWESVRDNLEFAVIRDRDYLSWRYGEHPLFSYELWGLTKRLGKNLLGLAVLKKELSEKLRVMDIIVRGESLFPLLEKVENLAYVSGKKKICMWLPNRFHPLLNANGFNLVKQGVICRVVGENFIAKDTIAKMFYFTMGDTDYL